MGDLVLPRELIKSSARGHVVDLNVLFRHLNFNALFECVLDRAVSPPSSADVARAYHFIGIHTAAACAQSATELAEFTRRYSRRLYSPPHLDAMPAAFEPFRQKMGNVFTLPRTAVRLDFSHCPRQSAGHAARPYSVVRGGRIGRFASLRHAGRAPASSQSVRSHTRSPMSPRVTLTVSTSQSSLSGPDWLIHRTDSPLASRASDTGFAPAYQGVHLDPLQSTIPQFPVPNPNATPMGNDFETDPPESVFSTPSPPKGSAQKHPFDTELKGAVWELALNFAESPPFYAAFGSPGWPGGVSQS